MPDIDWTTPPVTLDAFVANVLCGMIWEALNEREVHVCYLDEGHTGPCVCGACDHKDEHGSAYKHDNR